MKNKLYRRLPCDIYRLGAIEHWLGDLAAQGWRLERINSWRAVFRRAQPRTVRYRFSPYRRQQSEPEEAERGLFEEMGWEYVTSLFHEFAVYASEIPSAPELSTDPLVECAAFEALYKRLRSDLIFSLFRPPLLLLCYGLLFYPGLMWRLDTLFQGILEIYILLTLLYLSAIPRIYGQFRKIRALRASLRLGEPRPHDEPYPPKRRWFRWEMAEWLFLGVLCVLAFGQTHGLPVEYLDAPPPSPQLSAIEGREIYQPSVLHNDYSSCRNLLCTEFCERRQSDEIGGSDLLWLDSTYYEVRFPATAPALYRSILKHEPKDKTDTMIFGEAVPVPCTDRRFDEIACFRRQRFYPTGKIADRAWLVIVRRGGQVLSAQYTGSQPPDRLLDEIDAALTRAKEDA